VAAHLDPEDGMLTCAFEGGEVVRLAVHCLRLPSGAPVVYAAVDEFGAGIDFVREDGTRTDCGADLVQYLTNPIYRAHHVEKTHSQEGFACSLGARLVALRRHQGRSQREVARRLGMAAPNYARLESGRHVPSVATLVRLAETLGLPVAELLPR
jgi:DNA-binding XRE family transcriptional regulator